MTDKNVRIFMYLYDRQALGYVKIIKGQPFYGFNGGEATLFTEEEARRLCSKFSNSYICELEMPRPTTKEQRKEKKEKSAEIIVTYI